MRCPKCKFISYDDLSNCAKCAHDLTALSAELHGTCTETHLDFFLGPVIQAPSFDESGFSDSQALPPIDHGDMNFDDTSSGQYSAYGDRETRVQGVDLDESIGVDLQEDDISIELGDIMPIDLDQLDVSSELGDETSDSPTASFEQNIDLNPSSKYGANSDINLNDTFAGIDLTDNNRSGDDTVMYSSSDTIDDTLLAIDRPETSSTSAEGELDLDDELIAELSDTSGDFDATAALSSTTGSFESLNLSATEEFNLAETSLELDDSLMEELSGGDTLSDATPVDDLTGEFPLIPEGEEAELNSLDFSDIDVSDLLPSSDSQAQNTPLGPSMSEDTLNESGSFLAEELDLDNLGDDDLPALESDILEDAIIEEPLLDAADEQLADDVLFLEDDDVPPELPS